MSEMFSMAGYSANVFDIGDLSEWDASNVTSMTDMFTDVGHDATTLDVKIPFETNELANTATIWHGKKFTIYAELNNNRTFTLIN